MAQPAKSKRTIAINAEYRLAFPDADNIVIERLVIVDPTRSPNFKDGDDPTIRTEWRNIGKYFGTVPEALTHLLEHSVRTGQATALHEVLDEITAFRRHIDALLGVGV